MALPSILVQAQGIELRPASTAPIETTPGKVVTVSLLITNTTRQSQTLEGQAFLPPGWRTLMRRPQLEVGPGRTDMLLVSVSIPLETPAGQYPFRYRIQSPKNLYLDVETTLSITIIAMRGLDLQFTDAPRYVIAGESIAMHFTLVNKGNDITPIRLRTKTVGIDTVFIDSTVIHLRPNQLRHIKLTGFTERSLQKKTRILVELFATVITDTTVVAHSSAPTDIIPRLDYVSTTTYRYPLLVTVQPTGSEQGYRTQFEVSGSAPLSEGGKDNLSLLLRSPETITKSVLGLRDEYRINYKSKKLDLYAGDQNYSLTQLTEFARYGFGGGGRFTVSPVTIGGFYNKTRFYSPALEQYSGFLAVQIRKNLSASVNALRKHEADRSTIYSFSTAYQPSRGTNVDIEYGRSINPQGREIAYAGRLSSQLSWINADLRYIYAGPLYSGYYHDMRSIAASTVLFPWKLLRIDGYLRDERRNLNRDTLQYIAPRDQYYETGIGYSDYLSVHYRMIKRTDQLPNPKFHQYDYTYLIRAGYNFTQFSIFANTDLGWIDDRLLDKRAPYSRYYLSTGLRLFGLHSINATAEYDEEINVESDEKQKRFSANLFLLAQLGAKSRCILNVYGSRAVSSITQTYSIIDLTLEHTFSFGHTISFHGRRSEISPATEQVSLAYVAGYTIPISVPLGRSGSIGEISGRIVDVENNRGIAKALLFAGDATALSDNDGYFRFPGFPPGTYYLQVDKVSIGFDRVTTKPLPLEISLSGGEAALTPLGVVRSCAITGFTILYGFKERMAADSLAPELVELRGQPDIVVQLSSETETLRRVSDNRGRFTFADIRPGIWTLTVPDGQLPDNHLLEKTSFNFNLRPGDRSAADVKIKPRRRAIRIIQQGDILEQNRRTPAVRPSRPPQVAPPSGTSLITYNTARGGFFVQASSWRSRWRAANGVNDAKSLTGKPAYIEKVRVPGIGVRYRVYVGPLQTREEAEAIEKIIVSGK